RQSSPLAACTAALPPPCGAPRRKKITPVERFRQGSHGSGRGWEGGGPRSPRPALRRRLFRRRGGGVGGGFRVGLGLGVGFGPRRCLLARLGAFRIVARRALQHARGVEETQHPVG